MEPSKSKNTCIFCENSVDTFLGVTLGADHLIRGGGAMVFPSLSNFFFRLPA